MEFRRKTPSNSESQTVVRHVCTVYLSYLVYTHFGKYFYWLLGKRLRAKCSYLDTDLKKQEVNFSKAYFENTLKKELGVKQTMKKIVRQFF